jgi:rhodanese-related sulfurtransferase
LLLRTNSLPNIFAEKITIMGLLSMLGLGGKSESIQDFVTKGAIIIDVRTVGEFREGHIKGSKNIPLDTINGKLNEIKKLDKPVIVCCRSGMRSAQAASVLKSVGIEVINGGGWQSLEGKL